MATMSSSAAAGSMSTAAGDLCGPRFHPTSTNLTYTPPILPPSCRQQRKYRQLPDLAITRLREAQGQLRLLASSYGQFSQSDQDKFVQSAELELHHLRQTLEELRGVSWGREEEVEDSSGSVFDAPFCSCQVRRPKQTTTQKKLTDARNGAILQMVEAATLGKAV